MGDLGSHTGKNIVPDFFTFHRIYNTFKQDLGQLENLNAGFRRVHDCKNVKMRFLKK